MLNKTGVCIFVFWFLFFGFLSGCAKKEKPEDAKKQPQQQILTFSIGGFTTGGKKDWQLEGESADIDGDMIDLKKVTMKTFKEEGSMVLTSDKGKFDRANSHLHLYQNVVMVSNEGMRMTTESLDWFMKSKEIKNEDFVTIVKDKMKVTGTGLYGMTDSKKAYLKKDITVHIEPSSVITCDGPLEIDYQNNIAVFNKNVVAVDDRGTITSDKADVYFDTKSRGITKVVLTGKPVVTFYQEGEGMSFGKNEGIKLSEE